MLVTAKIECFVEAEFPWKKIFRFLLFVFLSVIDKVFESPLRRHCYYLN